LDAPVPPAISKSIVRNVAASFFAWFATDERAFFTSGMDRPLIDASFKCASIMMFRIF
jgi:hypothetical protein